MHFRHVQQILDTLLENRKKNMLEYINTVSASSEVN